MFNQDIVYFGLCFFVIDIIPRAMILRAMNRMAASAVIAINMADNGFELNRFVKYDVTIPPREYLYIKLYRNQAVGNIYKVLIYGLVLNDRDSQKKDYGNL